MTKFLLIRHGETDAVGKVLTGWSPGWRLNQAGRRQVRRLTARLSGLPLRAVYTSPLERAIETAAPIAADHGLTARIAEDLGDICTGDWEGRRFEDLETMEAWREYNARRSCNRPPGGELISEVQDRMVRRLGLLRESHPGEWVAVISHGDPLRSVVCHCLGISLDLVTNFDISPASVSILEAASWGQRLVCLNLTGELG
jgi:probable phosphoglycerate mutase